MPDGDDTGELEGCLEVGERIDTRRDIEERVRPAAAATDAAVLEIPCRHTVRGQIEAEAIHERPVVLGAPVPAVCDDRNRMGPGARREEELHELARVRAVGMRGTGHAPGRIRTCGLALRRRALYPLSYGRGETASLTTVD